MRTNYRKPFVLVMILFLARRIAAGSRTVYVVTGACCDYNGVYEAKRVKELHYKKLGEADYRGHLFLYKGSQHGNTWILGQGRTLSTAKAYYRAPAVEGRPPADQWSEVWDESREGKEEGQLAGRRSSRGRWQFQNKDPTT